ncbi:MAG: restriction endonuclease [Candidatus Omnitrophica bacterium CG11_big_fil_rev_8_21_14_0_20_42_13]|uniref:Restriction endonuclease n=1 Tax=Candidatus Ghiorseimicrobium undicola TaxID=1974746 RepID=A0A2H0LYE4_9BACT|nr:MAG: restriction endonuclease [Candidatus Omnitrophica bacterium CG11_big_fil_rev_8_21_14_0_20_42_13]
MKIAGVYSFNKGKEIIEKNYPELLSEIKTIISSIDAGKYKVKKSKEKTMKGRLLFSPIELNNAFKTKFKKNKWKTIRVKCAYSSEHYLDGHKSKETKGAFREMDFVKDGLGVELQFGKYAFMVYNVCAKMTIFNKLKYIKYGVEVVPIKELAESMSTGVSYFEQFVWDLEHRGVSDIDIPVLIYGIGV